MADLNVQTEIDALNSTTGGATTFASRVIAVLNKVVGTANPFGTASLRDAGTAEGELPPLLADGTLPESVIPVAGENVKGGVVLATNIDDTRTNAVTTANILRTSVVDNLPANIISSTDIGFVDMSIPNAAVTSSTVYTLWEAPGAGFFFISGGGSSGSDDVSTVTAGGDTTFIYGDVVNPVGITEEIIIPGGGYSSAIIQESGMVIVPILDLLNKPSSMVIAKSYGAKGGRVNGFAGTLLWGFIQEGTFKIDLGTTGLDATYGNGYDGFALFLQVN